MKGKLLCIVSYKKRPISPNYSKKIKRKKNVSSSLLVNITVSLVFLFCFFVKVFAQFCKMKILFIDFLRKQTEV
jgi:hypothetical protein